MTKADLADRLYEKIGLPKKEATAIVETLFDSMKNDQFNTSLIVH